MTTETEPSKTDPRSPLGLRGSAIICALCCPLGQSIRYIGKTVNLEQRFQAHVRDAKSGKLKYHHGHWIRKVIAAGELPKAIVLCAVPPDARWQDWEKFFIASAMHLGFSLTNGTRGGEGLSLTDPEAIERLKESMRRAWADPEKKAWRVARIVEALSTEESFQARCKAQGSPEARKRKSEASKAFYATTEGKAQMSATWKQVWSTPEMKAKKSAATKAGWADPEAAALRRARMSEGKRLGWARKKAAQASK